MSISPDSNGVEGGMNSLEIIFTTKGKWLFLYNPFQDLFSFLLKTANIFLFFFQKVPL